MAKLWSTWTNDKSALRTLSLPITGLELEMGVRERGGIGGGKGWSTGVPYGRGIFREWLPTELGSTDEEIGGTNSDDEVDVKKVEGLTRLMAWFPFLTVSRESTGKPDIDEVEWEAGIWTVGAGENKPLGAAEVIEVEFCLPFFIAGA